MRKFLILLSILFIELVHLTFSQTLIISLPDTALTVGATSLSIPIVVQNFNNVGALSIEINYNPVVLKFTGISNTEISGIFATADKVKGIISIAWFSPDGVSNINISNGILLNLKFNYTQGASPLNFDTSQSVISDLKGISLPVFYRSGSVKLIKLIFTKVLPDTSINVHQTMNFTYTISEQNNIANITFALIHGPGSINSNGLYALTPWVKLTGKNKVIVSATDGKSTAFDTAIINVIDHSPVFTKVLPDSLHPVVGIPIVFKFEAMSPDNDTLTFSLVMGPIGSSITPDGLFTWTPTTATGYYRVIVQVTDGVLSALDIKPIGGIKEKPGIPNDYELSQNYPNPFNPTTNIDFSIPKESIVQLKVYNLLGQEVATLVNTHLKTGNYTETFNAVNLPSGIYIYSITAGDFSFTRKLTILK